MRWLRIAELGQRQLVLNRGRWALLTATTVTALSVFLVMNALSNASAGELDDAVDATLGYEGTYSIEVPNELALPLEEVARSIGRVVRGSGPTTTVTFVDLPDAVARCAGSARGQSRSESPESVPRLVIVLDTTGTSTLDRGKPIKRSPAQWCLDGIVVDPLDTPQLAQFVAGALGDQTAPLLVGREQLARAVTAQRTVYSVRNLSVFPVTARPVDRIRSGLERELGPRALRSGQARGWVDTIGLHRVDSGAELRAAGQGVQLVYGLIGVAVLGVGGAALLVAQLMSSQTRGWFYALAVAWGARRRDIVLLAAVEVLAIVIVATTSTIAFAAVVDAPLSRWTTARFGQAIHVFDPPLMGWLVVASSAVTLAATAPAAIAVARTDPLDILE